MICSPHSNSAIAEVELELRRHAERDRLLPEIANDGGAWSILLYLFSRQASQVNVGAICAHSSEPRTTVLRRLAVLESYGFIERRGGHTDKRVSFIRLRKAAVDRIVRYTEAVTAFA